MKKIYIFFVIFFVTLSFSISGEIKYKVSGKVVHEGNGISNIRITAFGKKVNARTFTNSLGEFSLYLANGIYDFTIFFQKGFLGVEKTITVKNKNINNVIFFLEKGCKVSGFVKCEDGTKLVGDVTVYTDRGKNLVIGDIKENGSYTTSYIPAGKDVEIIAHVDGMQKKKIKGFSLEEGEELKDINFIFPPKRVSIHGKVYGVDTETNKKIALNKDNEQINISIKNKEIKSDFKGCYAFINEEGEFFFYNVIPGKFTLFIITKLFKRKEIEIILRENEVKSLIIEVEALTLEEVKKLYPNIIIEKKK